MINVVNNKKEENVRKLAIIILLFIFSISVFAGGFIHPLEFKGTKAEKKEVIKYIKENVKKTYSKIGMDDPMTLRMMEKEELKAFKKLTKVKNRKLLDKVIATYCSIGMCNYTTLLMMYNEQESASKESLSW